MLSFDQEPAILEDSKLHVLWNLFSLPNLVHCLNFMFHHSWLDSSQESVILLVKLYIVVICHLLLPIKCRSLGSPRFLCRLTAFCSTCWSHGTSECSPEGKQQICRSNSGSAHFHVSWLSDFIFYPKPLYKSLHQLFFYSFKTILPSESGVTLHYSTILP